MLKNVCHALLHILPFNKFGRFARRIAKTSFIYALAA
jgi:hypothetical protein